MAVGDRPHLVRLGETSWRIWRECVVRSPGFPAAGIRRFCDPELAELARRTGAEPSRRPAFDARWPAALARARATARELAGEPRFREAVAWQNPDLVSTCLDVTRLRRHHELTIASHAQRYFVKNDTIGFFGPLAWARWTDAARPICVRPGPQLIARQSVYFEGWAIDRLAQKLARDPELEPWLRPRLVASCLLEGAMLHRPRGEPLPLTDDEAGWLARCDGTRTVLRIASETAAPVRRVLAQLREWRDVGIVHLDLGGPVEARPEATLRGRIEQVADPGPRLRALAALSQLEAARDAAALAAGDPDTLVAELATLNRAFERITGSAATRRPGETYAGRTLVYLDAARDVRVELGRPLLALITEPLALVLDSARWLLASTAARYEELLLHLFAGCVQRAGTGPVTLAMLTSMATPYFMAERPQPLADALAAFHERWARVLRPPPGARRHAVSVDSVGPGIRTEFPSQPLRWAAAVHHSPDLLLAVPRGMPPAAEDTTVVLGELHLAMNTLDNRPFIELHDHPERLLAAVEADYRGRRVFHVPPKEWPQVSARTYPPPLLSRKFTYWSLYDDGSGAPGPVLPAAGLTVHRGDGRLLVRSRPDGAELDLLEVLGEQLSNVVYDAFSITPDAAHRPRIAIGRLVVQRESWLFDAGNVAWAAAAERAERFRLAQTWRESHQMPERAFYRSRREKPRFVDFRSVSLVELLARAIRRSAADAHPVRFSLTEMLPDIDQTWLVDADGARYTAEIRCVTVDKDNRAPPTGPRRRPV